MNVRLHLVFALAAAVALPACQAGERGQAPVASQEGSVPAASPPAATSAPEFATPSDGRITAAQVQQYVAVRRRAIDLAKQRAGSGSVIQMLTEVAAAETQAAEALGQNVSEYRWIQARIAEASTPAVSVDAAAILEAIEAASAKSGAQLQKTAEAERGIVTRSAPDAAVVAHNRTVLEPFRAELAALEQASAHQGV